MQTPEANDIKWVSLVRNGVTTHSFDSAQRLVDVPIAGRTATAVRATLTNQPNLAPPGWYMLFVVSTAGVPSVATWVHVT
jgi:hypothetical protein